MRKILCLSADTGTYYLVLSGKKLGGGKILSTNKIPLQTEVAKFIMELQNKIQNLEENQVIINQKEVTHGNNKRRGSRLRTKKD